MRVGEVRRANIYLSMLSFIEKRRLLWARVVWVMALALTVGVFVPAIVYNFTYRRLDALNLYSSALQQLRLAPDFYAIYMTTLESVMVLAFLIASAVIFWRRHDSDIALVMSLALMTYGATQGPSYFILAGAFYAARIPVAALWMLRAVTSLLVFYLFPDAKFVPRWTRWLMLPYTLWEALHAYRVFVQMGPGPDQLHAHELFLLGTLAFFVIGLGTQVYRYRWVSDSIERQQTKWVVAGLTVALLGNGTFLALEFAGPALVPPSLWGSPLFRLFYRMGVNLILIYVPVTLTPVFMAVAILRYRLWDIDIVINRALVYSALTALVASIYMLIVGLLSVLLQTGGNLVISMFATAVVAVLFHPLRERLQRAVNRLMYGERNDPYAVISHLGQRLQGALAPDTLLPEICQTVAQTLKLPYVGIAIRHADDFEVAATYGTPVRDPLVLPLTHQGEMIGRMLIEPGNRDESFIRADWRLLADIARHAGIGVHIVLLTHDLQRSRQSLVTAREEERRRLRRDLHDGLGPTIASMMLKLDTVQNVMPRDPQRAGTMINDLRMQSQSVLSDVRRIAYALRPPVLDDLGLTEALREYLNHLPSEDGSRCKMTLEAPETSLALPAAVEVAVYRITTEALTNVLRHAEASNCNIRLRVEKNQLSLEIADDGKGMPDVLRQGVGLTSMKERASELSGTFEVQSVQDQGTQIAVTLPL